MKRDVLNTVLAVVLLGSSLMTAGMCYKFLKLSHEYRFLQDQVARVNQRRALLNTYAVELNEYSIRNPSLTPLLDQMNLRLRAVTNTVSSRP
jgi:hypothetical protein